MIGPVPAIPWIELSRPHSSDNREIGTGGRVFM